jgi:hypothetical protein
MLSGHSEVSLAVSSFVQCTRTHLASNLVTGVHSTYCFLSNLLCIAFVHYSTLDISLIMFTMMVFTDFNTNIA